MINVAKARQSLETVAGDILAISKPQMAELLAEVEIGQQARRALTNLKSLTAIAASSAGIVE